MRKSPYIAMQNGELKARYADIKFLQRENYWLLSTMEGYDRKLWEIVHENDEKIARLWLEIHEIEQLWRKGNDAAFSLDAAVGERRQR